MRTTVGVSLGVLGLMCALVGLFLINGTSIEFPGIMLGALGYYFCLQCGPRRGAGPGRYWASSP